MRPSRTVPDDNGDSESHRQLTLPFLTADDVATIDQAAAAIERATTRAVAARHTAEADQLDQLGARLLDILVRHAERVRSGQ